MRAQTLPFGPLTGRTAPICVDMQNLFAEATPWPPPWMPHVLPVVRAGSETLSGERIVLRLDNDDLDVQRPKVVLKR